MKMEQKGEVMTVALREGGGDILHNTLAIEQSGRRMGVG